MKNAQSVRGGDTLAGGASLYRTLSQRRWPRGSLWVWAAWLGAMSWLEPVAWSAEQVPVEQGVECSDVAHAVANDAQGRTLVAGTVYDNRVLEWEGGHAHFGDFALARLRVDGTLDSSFGNNGSWTMNLGDFDALHQVVSDSRSITLAGTTSRVIEGQAGPGDVVVARLSNNGRLLRRFGWHGVSLMDIGGDDSVTGVVSDRRGGVFIAGNTTLQQFTHGYVARLDRLGRRSRRFGAEGVVAIDTGGQANEVLAVRRSVRGVLVAGRTATPAGSAAFVSRVGSECHGAPAVSLIEVGGEPAGEAAAFFDRAGRAYVTLQHLGPEGRARVTTVVFDTRGQQIPDAGAVVDDLPSGFALAAAVPAWGGGWFLSGAVYPEDFAFGEALLARVRPGLGVDPEFAGGISRWQGALEYASFNQLAVSVHGVTAAGWDFSEEPQALPHSDAIVVRYTHAGQLDTGFGDGGVVPVDFQHEQAVCEPTVYVE